MDCGMVEREEIIERYVAGGLSDEDREAFEEHYFACDRCFDDLKTLQTLREELRQPAGASISRPRRFAGWAVAAGIAAAILLAAGLTRWMGRPATTTVVTTNSQPPPQAPVSAAPGTPAAPTRSLEQLARVEPPPYTPLTLRGPTDEATSRFKRGMERYRHGDYSAAAADLRAAADLDPDAPHIRYFLGVSRLMAGEDAGAIRDLRAAIALGDSPYLEDANFYLAKAYLRRHDLRSAETRLTTVVRLHGSRAAEARDLLGDLKALKEQ